MTRDHANSEAQRMLQPMNDEFFGRALNVHASTALYVVPPDEDSQSPAGPVTYCDNNQLWEDAVLIRRLHHGARIVLDGFFLFEWFPRSPGLYFTKAGRQAREGAEHRITKIDDGTVVYDPYGKQSMLEGGVGNIRLGPIELRDGQCMLMAASANGVCHQGFPVALPLASYAQVIQEIRERGAVVRRLAGELQQIPRDLNDLYQNYTGVPKLYLHVEEIGSPSVRKSRMLADLEVSVAVNFYGDVDGAQGVFATYATFDPSVPSGLADVVDWMRHKYVGAYRGVVLTDFDEHENHFAEARFSLKKIMNLKLSADDFTGLPGVNIYNVQGILNGQKETQYRIYGGNFGSVGDNARAEKFTQVDGNPIRGISDRGESER